MTSRQNLGALAGWRDASGLATDAKLSAGLAKLARRRLPATEPALVRNAPMTDLVQDRHAAHDDAPRTAAERQRRYRRRLRGEDVPHRRPGPPPTSAAALRHQMSALERENAALREKLAAAETVPAQTSRGRQASARRLADELLEKLGDQDPGRTGRTCGKPCGCSRPR